MCTQKLYLVILAWLGSTVLIGGCANVPKPSPLNIDVPTHWRGSSVANPPLADPHALPIEYEWWKALNDPLLQQFVETALLEHRELVRAQWRQQQREFDKQSEWYAKWPQLSAGFSASYTQPLRGSGRDSIVVDGVRIPIGPTSQRSNFGSASFSWQRDIFPLNQQSLTDQQRFNDDVAIELDSRELRTRIATEATELYWRLANVQRRQRNQALELSATTDSLATIKLRQQEGLALPSEVDQSEQRIRDAQLRERQMQDELRSVCDAIAVFFNRVPQRHECTQANLPRVPAPSVAMPTPLEALDRRSDVRRARLALDKTLIGLEVARLNRYPRVSISASVSPGSSVIRRLLENPIATFGTNLAIPLLDWQRLRIDQHQAQTAVREAQQGFQEALLNALRDIEERLREAASLELQEEQTQRRLNDAARVVRVAKLRYENGVATKQMVRDAEQQQLLAADSSDDLLLKRWQTALTTWRAFGGYVPSASPAVASTSHNSSSKRMCFTLLP